MIGTGGSATGNPAFQNTFCVGTQSAHSLVFLSSDTERMRITSSGNVGIGTTSPGATLDVVRGYNNSFKPARFVNAGSVPAHVSYDTVQIVQDDVPTLRLTEYLPGSSIHQELSIGVGDGYGNINCSVPLRFWGGSPVSTVNYNGGGGTLAMAISTAGNVGIGTSSPSAKLHIFSNTAPWYATVLAEGAVGRFAVKDPDDAYVGSIDIQNYIAFNLSAGTDASYGAITERMRINASGNVGIGTTSPTQRLDVSGSVNVRSASPTVFFDRNGSYTWRIANGDGTTYPLSSFNIANNAGTAAITVTAANNVGIGTTSPTNLLHLKATTNPVIRLEGASDSGYVDYNGTRLQLSAGGGAMYFVTGNSEKARIDSSGNVGIGTTSPGVALDVWGATGVRARVVATSGGTSGLILSSAGATAYTVKAGNGDSSFRIDQDGTDRVTIASGGNVGIGTTSPAVKLEVESGGQIISTVNGGTSSATKTLTIKRSGQPQVNFGTYPGSWTSALQIQSEDNARYLWLSPISNGGNARLVSIGSDFDIMPGNSQAATFTTSGNVGIGTTSPSQRLHVNGNATAADFILTSDRRRKTDLEVIEDALGKVKRLVGYTYRPIDGDRRRAGLMAQDVEAVAPEPVYTDDEGWKSLSYEQMIPYIIEAIKALDKKIEALA
jgi:hypothetical protein